MRAIKIEEIDVEAQIRNVMDRPILRAAIVSKADILLTGDRNFSECSEKAEHLQKCCACSFLDYYYNEKQKIKKGLLISQESLLFFTFVRRFTEQLIHSPGSGHLQNLLASQRVDRI